MSAPPRFRYEPVPDNQSLCTACWAEGVRYRIWEGRTWVATYCLACAEEHRALHSQVQLDFWEEDAP